LATATVQEGRGGRGGEGRGRGSEEVRERGEGPVDIEYSKCIFMYLQRMHANDKQDFTARRATVEGV
jgi:hypothetical protein